MATTKQAETRAETDVLLAEEYLSDLIYAALLEIGEPAKASEITLEIANDRITFPLVRRVLTDSPRFLSIDRMWNLAARYMDKGRPTERNLQEVLRASGRPLSTSQLATELSAIYDRPGDVYLGLVGKIATTNRDYFKTAHGEIAPRSWLPLTDADEEADVLFDNDLTAAQVKAFAPSAKGVSWATPTYAEATRKIVEAASGRPVPQRILGVLAWRALGGKYDGLKHFVAAYADPGLVWLSSGRWITRSRADGLEALLADRAALIGAEDGLEEVASLAAPAVVADVPVEIAAAPEPEAAAPVAKPGKKTAAPATNGRAPAATSKAAKAPEPVVELAPVVVAPAPPAAPIRKPLEVTEGDLSALEQLVSGRETAIDVAELLALQYEVVPGDPSYKDDVATLFDVLKASDRFQYVGAGRFREPNSLPLYVYSVPESLSFPDLQFVSLEGEIMDEEIEDEGFAGNLRGELRNPLAQDVLDDDGAYSGDVPADTQSLRLVVKAHHKEIGTFPLCQVPDGFFPSDALVVEVTLRDGAGSAHEVIVNNEMRIAFNLFGLYEQVAPDSGGVFLLEKMVRPFEFRFVPQEQPDPQIYVAPERMDDLYALREQADDGGDLAAFDIACETLALHAKGLDFVQLLTEVNVVRRVTRRKLASILSNYYCFAQKPGQPLWRFDAKKRDLGTDRAKRKYLKR